MTTDSSEQIVFGKNSTFNGTTIADLGTVTTADINGGTIDGISIGTNSVCTKLIVDNVVLDISTNLSILNDKLLNAFSKFKRCLLYISIEGIKERYQYIRGGNNFTFADLENNLKIIKGRLSLTYWRNFLLMKKLDLLCSCIFYFDCIMKMTDFSAKCATDYLLFPAFLQDRETFHRIRI